MMMVSGIMLVLYDGGGDAQPLHGPADEPHGAPRLLGQIQGLQFAVRILRDNGGEAPPPPGAVNRRGLLPHARLAMQQRANRLRCERCPDAAAAAFGRVLP